MKVVMVTPYPPKADGIGQHTHGLVRELRSLEGHEVEVLTLRSTATDEPGAVVHRLLSVDPRSVGASVDMLRQARPDVIHVQFAIPALGLANVSAVIAGVRARRALGSRLVFTLHEVRRELDLLGGVGRVLYRRLVALADGTLVHTDEARQLVVGECRPAGRPVWQTPLGASAPRPELTTPAVIEEVRARYRVGDRPFALCFGYLHPDKGIEHLIEAVARLRSTMPSRGRDFDVLIAGSVRRRSGVFRGFERWDRAYAADLQRRVDRHGLAQQVRFVGFVPDQDVAALFTAARVVVVPCTKVTQSSVLSSATVAGAPVIASDLPGLRETVGDGGILVAPGDPDALAAALASVMFDDRLAADLRDRQRRRVAAIDLATVAGALSGIYRELVAMPVRTTPSEVHADGA
jgi:glycosyltransferase involved in cell wall biosynthesis